jgi:FlaA1/EpsC-like NDP-sugar epimerase
MEMLELMRDKQTLAVSAALLVVFITMRNCFFFFLLSAAKLFRTRFTPKVVLWLLSKKKQARKHVLLVGASNSGKTRMFCQVN